MYLDANLKYSEIFKAMCKHGFVHLRPFSLPHGSSYLVPNDVAAMLSASGTW